MQRITDGTREKAPRRRIKNPEVRTWLITILGVLAVAFIFVPLVLKNSGGVNTVYAIAQSSRKVVVTPEPFAFDVTSPTPAIDATPEPESTIQISEYLQLQLDDDYPSVEQLQSRLMELGYLDSDEPTTIYGSATAAAVSLFQRTQSYEMNGVADIDLQERLFSNRAAPYESKLGDSGADVESMQSRLHELGYYDGKINGYFGVATEEALRAFQVKNEIEADSIFNVSDRNLLYSPDARPKIDPTPTPSPTPKSTKKPSSAKKTSAPVKTASVSASAPADTATNTDTSTPSFSASYSPDGLVSVATAMLGKPYVSSEESPSKGFDCSGLVYYCLRTCGVSTGRYNSTAFSNVSGWTNISSIDALSKGDLVFFNSPTSSSVNHTGIYIGGGQFIHASSSKGQVLKSSINTNYWVTYFVNGRRVF